MVRMLSTSQARRDEVAKAALGVFAARGFESTTVAQVAEAAGISSAYAFKLFGSKEELFIGALRLCFDRISEVLRDAAGATDGATPEMVLDRMALRYSQLIADRDLLMIQVHAQSAASVPRIRESLQQGLQQVVECVQEHSRASDEQVQRFLAYGQLCHLVVTADIRADLGDWARLVARGIRHPDDGRITPSSTTEGESR